MPIQMNALALADRIVGNVGGAGAKALVRAAGGGEAASDMNGRTGNRAEAAPE
jgi:hypothetical protein